MSSVTAFKIDQSKGMRVEVAINCNNSRHKTEPFDRESRIHARPASPFFLFRTHPTPPLLRTTSSTFPGSLREALPRKGGRSIRRESSVDRPRGIKTRGRALTMSLLHTHTHPASTRARAHTLKI
jgi:hypothetical protein